MNDKYEEIFKQFWGDDYKDCQSESATEKMVDMNIVNEKVVKLCLT